MNALLQFSQSSWGRRIFTKRGRGDHNHKDNGLMSEQEGSGSGSESFFLFEQSWFLERVLGELDCVDLIECSLVNHLFLKISRKFMKTYQMTSAEALSCLSTSIASADSLTLKLGYITADILAFRRFPMFKQLTSIEFQGIDSSLGFSYSCKSDITLLKHLQVWPMGKLSQATYFDGLSSLSSLHSLKICQPATLNIFELCYMPNLQTLELSNSVYLGNGFLAISYIESLLHLSISHPSDLFPSDTFPVLGQMTQLHSLRIIDLSCSRKFLNEVVMKMSKLRSLYLVLDEFTDEGLSLQVLDGLTQLNDLEICFQSQVNDMSKLGILKISNLKHFKAVVTYQRGIITVLPYLLDVRCLNSLILKARPDQQQQEFLYPKFSEFISLTELEICQPTTSALTAIGQLEHLTQLTLVAPSPTTVIPFSGEAYKNLTSLTIKSPGMRLSALIKSLGCLQALRKLCLSWDATEDNETQLNALSNLTNLTSFFLDIQIMTGLNTLCIDVGRVSALEELTFRATSLNTLDIFDPCVLVESLENLRWLKILSSLLHEGDKAQLFKLCHKLRRITLL